MQVAAHLDAKVLRFRVLRGHGRRAPRELARRAAATARDHVADARDLTASERDQTAELRDRALAYLEQRDAALSERRVALGVSDEVAAVEGLSPTMLVALGEKEVKTLDDLGDLATDELVEIEVAGRRLGPYVEKDLLNGGLR